MARLLDALGHDARAGGMTRMRKYTGPAASINMRFCFQSGTCFTP
jgi:hypothetical protein